MPITLNIKPYCEECDEFEPARDEKLYADGKAYLSSICCEHRYVCDRIEEFLTNKKENEPNTTTEKNKTGAVITLAVEGPIGCGRGVYGRFTDSQMSEIVQFINKVKTWVEEEEKTHAV